MVRTALVARGLMLLCGALAQLTDGWIGLDLIFDLMRFDLMRACSAKILRAAIGGSKSGVGLQTILYELIWSVLTHQSTADGDSKSAAPTAASAAQGKTTRNVMRFLYRNLGSVTPPEFDASVDDDASAAAATAKDGSAMEDEKDSPAAGTTAPAVPKPINIAVPDAVQQVLVDVLWMICTYTATVHVKCLSFY